MEYPPERRIRLTGMAMQTRYLSGRRRRIAGGTGRDLRPAVAKGRSGGKNTNMSARCGDGKGGTS